VDKADMNGLTTLEYTLQVVAETVAVRSG
jgi:hypothetical protein